MAHKAQQCAALPLLGWWYGLWPSEQSRATEIPCSWLQGRTVAAVAQRKHSTAVLTMRSPHTSAPVQICTHTGHRIAWTCQTLKTGEALGTGDGEETLKQAWQKWFKLCASEDVKGELATGQAVTTSSKCAQCNSAESAFPEMPQQDTVFWLGLS